MSDQAQQRMLGDPLLERTAAERYERRQRQGQGVGGQAQAMPLARSSSTRAAFQSPSAAPLSSRASVGC